jgi:uncharacterized linocin/CFP29 family protein
MNNLRREPAPISDAAWTDIETRHTPPSRVTSPAAA